VIRENGENLKSKEELPLNGVTMPVEVSEQEKAAFRLKALNRPGLTSRAGMPSSRNLAKRYRPPRLVVDSQGNEKPHPLDTMRGGPSYSLRGNKLTIRTLTERPRDTTGSFGDVSTFQGSRVDKSQRPLDFSKNPNLERASQIVKIAGKPGRSPRSKNRKRGGDHTPQIVHVVYNNKVQAQFYNLRNDILTLDIISTELNRDFLGSQARSTFEKLNSWLRNNTTKDFLQRMERRDIAAKATTLGEVKAGHIHVERIKSLGQRINKALLSLRVPESTYKPTVKPAIYQPNVTAIG
jgi:hypothetical protein